MPKLELPPPYRTVDEAELLMNLRLTIQSATATVRNNFGSKIANRAKAEAQRSLAEHVLASMIVDSLRRSSRTVITTAPAFFESPSLQALERRAERMEAMKALAAEDDDQTPNL